MFNHSGPGFTRAACRPGGQKKAGDLLAAVAMSLALASCATPQSTRFYTLSSPARSSLAEQAKSTITPATLYIEVASVAVPERLKRPQLVVSAQADTAQVNVLEQDRWSSPFNEELRDAFASQISAQLDAVDTTRGGRPMNQSLYRIAVVLHTLDVVPGKHLYANFGWSIRLTGNRDAEKRVNDASSAQVVSCQTRISKDTGSDINAVVNSIQSTVAEVSVQISAQLKTLAEQGNTHCLH